MRFMMIIKATKDSEAGKMPSSRAFEEMGKFNEEMVKAGVMLAAEGLQASSKGARVRLGAGKPVVVDGPFSETKELIAGFWMIQAKSKAEAIDWASRVPNPGREDIEIELRQVFEVEDFPSDVLSPEAAAREQAMRKDLEQKAAKS